jgi:ribonucleoside-diphosphate reductase alpha chain
VLDETLATSTETSNDGSANHPILDYLLGLCRDLPFINAVGVATRVLGAAKDGATMRELRDLIVHTAAARIFEEPEYSKLAARVLAHHIQEDVVENGVTSFRTSIEVGHQLGLVNDRVLAFVTEHAEALEAAVKPERDLWFEYFGIKTVQDRYLLRHPKKRIVVETPQYFFLRVACGVSDRLDDVLELYEVFSKHDYIPSSPTLFNAGTTREQLSSCFLLDSPQDDLEDIYKRYADVAKLSKFAGGIGLSYTRVRAQGSHIQGTNGLSNGIVPFLKTLDASVAAVNQGGKRKGAACVYLEPWHADVEAFLELRDNTGDEARRTHNLNIANWIPDLFMRRVEEGGDWSLFDPKVVPELIDTWGAEFEAIYERAEKEGKAFKKVKARDLYGRMMRTLAQTGNGWMCFKDASNRACNQTARKENVVHLSNLCTEILEITSGDETAVCNLGSINLAKHATAQGFDYDKLAATVRTAIRQLDRVIDRNFYPIPEAKRSNLRWRPVGLGVMGLQDVFFKLRLPFDSEGAREVSRRVAEVVYFHALKASCELAQELGPHDTFADTRAARGELQFDAWDVTPSADLDWDGLKREIMAKGLRNSLLIAVAPTATIASIVGCYECIEPQVSNLFKRETLSGEFLQVNRYLVDDLRDLGLWNAETRDVIKAHNGSVQGLADLPDELRALYRTAWELSMKALVDLAADRGAFIDQSQSLNLFQEQPNIGRLSSMYMFAWKRGLKTTYYLRSRPATRIAMTSTARAASSEACSLENPEYCESCQ